MHFGCFLRIHVSARQKCKQEDDDYFIENTCQTERATQHSVQAVLRHCKSMDQNLRVIAAQNSIKPNTREEMLWVMYYLFTSLCSTSQMLH